METEDFSGLHCHTPHTPRGFHISLRSAAEPYRGRLEPSGPLQGSAQKKQIRFSIVHHAMISEALQSILLGNKYLHKRIYFLHLSSWWQRRATAPAYFKSLGSRSDEIQRLEDILTLGTISRVSLFLFHSDRVKVRKLGLRYDLILFLTIFCKSSGQLGKVWPSRPDLS